MASQDQSGRGSGGKEKDVCVKVPADAKIQTIDLKGKTAQEIEDYLKKAADSGIGFIILNAPFRVPSARSVA
jgi:hypothetical protein